MEVLVARIGRPHGIRGEVTVQLFTDAPEDRFEPGAVFRAEGIALPELTVTKARWNKETLIVAFEQVPDRNSAEALRGGTLFIDSDDTDDDEDDAWYEHELVGLDVRVGGTSVGKVTALRTMTVQDLLVVELADGHEVFVPFVGEIVPEVNPAEGFIVLNPPAGLLELNLPGSNSAPDDGDDEVAESGLPLGDGPASSDVPLNGSSRTGRDGS